MRNHVCNATNSTMYIAVRCVRMGKPEFYSFRFVVKREKKATKNESGFLSVKRTNERSISILPQQKQCIKMNFFLSTRHFLLIHSVGCVCVGFFCSVQNSIRINANFSHSNESDKIVDEHKHSWYVCIEWVAVAFISVGALFVIYFWNSSWIFDPNARLE